VLSPVLLCCTSSHGPALRIFDESSLADLLLHLGLHTLVRPNIDDSFVSIVRSIIMRIESPAIFLKLPISVVQWTDMSSFQPSRDAVKVESVLEPHLH
jgi:hypothetical protein